MKDTTYYFPHDSNSHSDPKCSALINDFGHQGYGLYWALIELLHEQGGKLRKFPKLYDGLAFQLKVEKEVIAKQIEALINDYKLLKEDKNYIWSERVVRNLLERRTKYKNKSQAGRIGGLRSGKSRRSKQNEAVLERIEQKESKVKESKVNKTYILPVLSHFNLVCHKNFSLTKERSSVIQKCLDAGRTENQIKTAITNFSKDDWEERHKFCDLIYAIGTIRGIDNFDKWLNYKPSQIFRKP